MFDRLLEDLGVRLLSDLGGRVNHHWLVEGGGEKLVLRRWGEQAAASIEYERSLVAHLKQAGWPVAPLDVPIEFEGALWSLSPFLPGEPPPVAEPEERRAQGRLLAEFHAVTATFPELGPRPSWRRCEEVLADTQLDRTLSENESARPEEVRIVRWHLERARLRAEELGLGEGPSLPVHGDFATWNLRFEDGRLSGIFDFELARPDHRIADFVLAWRGKYDEVVEGYEEVSPLSPEERLAIAPVYWAQLVEDACRDMRQGIQNDGWTVRKLLTRSPLMGPDAEAVP